jgi:hypothetical protein
MLNKRRKKYHRRTKLLEVNYNKHNFYYKRTSKPKRGKVILGKYVIPLT